MLALAAAPLVFGAAPAFAVAAFSIQKSAVEAGPFGPGDTVTYKITINCSSVNDPGCLNTVISDELPDPLLFNPAIANPVTVQINPPAGQPAGDYARLPRTRVLVLTTYDLDEFAFGALQAGAAGFLLKNTRPAELVAAIRTVATGDAVVAPRITATLIEVALPHLAPPDAGAREGALSALTERERDVFLQVARGLTNSEIAQTLHLSESTVKAHFGRILVKLDLPSRVQAVILAYELGIVSPGS